MPLASSVAVQRHVLNTFDLVRSVRDKVGADQELSGQSVVQLSVAVHLAQHMLCVLYSVKGSHCPDCLQLTVTYKLNVTRPLGSACTFPMTLLAHPPVSLTKPPRFQNKSQKMLICCLQSCFGNCTRGCVACLLVHACHTNYAAARVTTFPCLMQVMLHCKCRQVWERIPVQLCWHM